MVELTEKERGEISEKVLIFLAFTKGWITLSVDATRQIKNAAKALGIPEDKYKAFLKHIGTILLDKTFA